VPFDEAVEIVMQVALGYVKRIERDRSSGYQAIQSLNYSWWGCKDRRFWLALLPSDEKVPRENLSIGTPGYMSPNR